MVRFVVMAAGLATRMGRDKLALPWKKTTVLGHVLKTVLEAMEFTGCLPSRASFEVHVIARQPIETYVLVDDIREFEKCGGVWHYSSSPRPLSETIRIGLNDLNSEVQNLAFVPGDQVGVNVQVLSECLCEVIKFCPDFLVPVAGDKTGSPIFFHKKYVPELLALQGEQGGKVILNRYPDRWRKFHVQERLFDDVDTPEQYEALFNDKSYR